MPNSLVKWGFRMGPYRRDLGRKKGDKVWVASRYGQSNGGVGSSLFWVTTCHHSGCHMLLTFCRLSSTVWRNAEEQKPCSNQHHPTKSMKILLRTLKRWQTATCSLRLLVVETSSCPFQLNSQTIQNLIWVNSNSIDLLSFRSRFGEFNWSFRRKHPVEIINEFDPGRVWSLLGCPLSAIKLVVQVFRWKFFAGKFFC